MLYQGAKNIPGVNWPTHQQMAGRTNLLVKKLFLIKYFFKNQNDNKDKVNVSLSLHKGYNYIHSETNFTATVFNLLATNHFF